MEAGQPVFSALTSWIRRKSGVSRAPGCAQLWRLQGGVLASALPGARTVSKDTTPKARKEENSEIQVLLRSSSEDQ